MVFIKNGVITLEWGIEKDHVYFGMKSVDSQIFIYNTM